MMYFMIWVFLSTPNIVIIQHGKERIAKAFGSKPQPLDGFDLTILVLLAPLGPIGWIIGWPMTAWWCSGFEED